LLEACGVVTLRRYQFAITQLEREVTKIQARSKAQLEQQVNESRAESKTLKTEIAEAAKALKSKERELFKQSRRVDKLRKSVEQSNRHRADLENVLKRLIETEQELAAARNHLMVVEVKLDILEGAANVLDARTRTTTAQQSSAPV
jgi:predicted RNase H-like nuclease (RuvC/YqgF family)